MATVLIIEDEMSLQFYLKNELTFEGYDVCRPLTASKGLAFVRQKRLMRCCWIGCCPKRWDGCFAAFTANKSNLARDFDDGEK